MLTIVDGTPLHGETIDVAARIAWTLRMARLTAGEGVDARLRALADALGTNAAHLSRVETGQRRDGLVADGYERALRLPVGSLRAPIDVLCRCYPEDSPRERGPVPVVTDVRQMSALTDAVSRPDRAVDGGQWLAWSSGLAQEGNIGFPAEEFKAVCRRLVSELGRSVAHAYPSRYEALTRLRCSAYGPLVVEVAREVMATPYFPGGYDLMSAIGEHWTPDAVQWCLELLSHPSPRHLTAGALGLENLGQIFGAPLWTTVVDPLIGLFDAAEAGSPAEEWSAHLIRLVPPQVWLEHSCRPGRPLPPRPGAVVDAGEIEQRLWPACEAAASAASSAVGLPDQPMLARLLYDVSYSPWESRAVTSYMLLNALPALADALGAAVHLQYQAVEDQTLRNRLVRRWACSPFAHRAAVLGDWLRSADPVVRSGALRAAGSAGALLEEADLVAGLADPETSIAALSAVGMSQHPLLTGLLAGDPAPADRHPEPVPYGLRWWASAGGRVTD
jgi:hypothetical protein